VSELPRANREKIRKLSQKTLPLLWRVKSDGAGQQNATTKARKLQLQKIVTPQGAISIQVKKERGYNSYTCTEL
jgi:hypothetical protein